MGRGASSDPARSRSRAILRSRRFILLRPMKPAVGVSVPLHHGLDQRDREPPGFRHPRYLNYGRLGTDVGVEPAPRCEGHGVKGRLRSHLPGGYCVPFLSLRLSSCYTPSLFSSKFMACSMIYASSFVFMSKATPLLFSKFLILSER